MPSSLHWEHGLQIISGATDTLKVPLSAVGCRGPPLSVKGVWRCERELGLALPRRPWVGAPTWMQRPLRTRGLSAFRWKVESV